MSISQFQKKILSWYKTNRRDLPWRPPALKLRRGKADPYKILVSEVMLQQTQVSRVVPKYKEFLKEFPTISILARAKIKKLLKVWAGLGYWRRALFLQESAKRIVKECKGKFPRDPEILETFPGIGHYTARAVACFAFGNKETFLDTNIRRVYLHFFFLHRKSVPDKEILPIAQKALSSISSHGNRLRYSKITPREWHYALFDYGAMVLKDKKINKRSGHYHKQSKFEGSFRSFRTATMHFLLSQSQNKATSKKLTAFLATQLARVEPLHKYSSQQVIDSLLKDNLIKKKRSSYSL